MNNIKNTLMQHIISGQYKEAKKVSFDSMTQKDFYNVIMSIGFSTESIAIYTFICFLLKEYESAYLHQLAAVVISQGLSHLEGAYSSGLFHARRAVELAPNNISYKEYLLLFNAIPDKLLDDPEAKIIAEEIVSQDPTNSTARKTIDEITRTAKYNSKI
jgi:hypothetical protein